MIPLAGLSCGRVFITVNTMKKVLMVMALFLACILLLMAGVYWYDQKYGSEGPFQNQHGH